MKLRSVQLFAGEGSIGELPAGDAPPTEFRIFPKGSFETSKGTFLYDDASAKSVMEKRAKKGNDLVADYEHQSLARPPVKAPAAGWYEIEAREDGLYAVNVRWTPVALEHFKNQEYRYFSPAFDVDEAGRVTDFVNMALTNLPATHKMEALIAATDEPAIIAAPAKTNAQEIKMPEEIMAALKALMDVLAKHEGMEEGQMMQALSGPLSKLGFIKNSAVAAADKPMDDAEACRAIAASATFVELTQKKNTDEAIGVVRSWRESHDKVVALTAEVETLRKASIDREFEETIVKGIGDKKLTPALVDGWVRKSLTTQGQAGLVQLRAFLDSAAPAVAPIVAQPDASGTIAPGGNLSAQERQIIALTRGSEKEYLEAKAKLSGKYV